MGKHILSQQEVVFKIKISNRVRNPEKGVYFIGTKALVYTVHVAEVVTHCGRPQGVRGCPGSLQRVFWR